MKTLAQWFDEYAVSHKNVTNKKNTLLSHVNLFSVVGLFMSIQYSATWIS
jgi:hypothetical protein